MNNNHSQNTETRLADDKIGSLIARYSIPTALAFVFFSVQAIIDGMIVGNFLGADALASINLIIPAYTIPSSIVLILGIGAQAQMSIAMGEKDYEKFKTTLKTSTIAIMTYALIVQLVFNAFPQQLVKLMGAKDVLYQRSLDYLSGLKVFVGGNLCFIFVDYLLKT